MDGHGDTVEFRFSERRNLTAAKRLLAESTSGIVVLNELSLMEVRPTASDPGLQYGKPTAGPVEA